MKTLRQSLVSLVRGLLNERNKNNIDIYIIFFITFVGIDRELGWTHLINQFRSSWSSFSATMLPFLSYKSISDPKLTNSNSNHEHFAETNIPQTKWNDDFLVFSVFLNTSVYQDYLFLNLFPHKVKRKNHVSTRRFIFYNIQQTGHTAHVMDTHAEVFLMQSQENYVPTKASHRSGQWPFLY